MRLIHPFIRYLQIFQDIGKYVFTISVNMIDFQRKREAYGIRARKLP